MSVFNYKEKFSYYPVPKVACTSLKKMFFNIENGFDFTSFKINGKGKSIHSFYSSTPFKQSLKLDRPDHLRFAVVRDPIDRLLSCYSNRVVFHKELSPRRLPSEAVQRGLKADPSLSEFIADLEGYRETVVSISHHSEPLVHFLGEDPAYFSKVYSLRNITDFVDRVSELVGRPIVLGREQTGGPKFRREELSAAEIEKLKMFYVRDYEIFSDYF